MENQDLQNLKNFQKFLKIILKLSENDCSIQALLDIVELVIEKLKKSSADGDIDDVAGESVSEIFEFEEKESEEKEYVKDFIVDISKKDIDFNKLNEIQVIGNFNIKKSHSTGIFALLLIFIEIFIEIVKSMLSIQLMEDYYVEKEDEPELEI
jgi:hypothetical protein